MIKKNIVILIYLLILDVTFTYSQPLNNFELSFVRHAVRQYHNLTNLAYENKLKIIDQSNIIVEYEKMFSDLDDYNKQRKRKTILSILAVFLSSFCTGFVFGVTR